MADRVIVGDDGHYIYLFRFPPECLKEVIIGYRISPDLQERITTVLQNEYPEAKLFRAVLNETEFDLDIELLHN